MNQYWVAAPTVARRPFHVRGVADAKRRDEALVLGRRMFSWSSVDERRLGDGVFV